MRKTEKMGVVKDRKIKERYHVDTGFFEDGLPYARIGTKPNIIVNIEALSFNHEPPSGFMLKQFIKSSSLFTGDYTVYLVGRRPNLPKDYLMDKMANDYAEMIRREFNKPVDIMGVSTGGQISLYLAADHPDIVRNLVVISAAYRLSENGVEVERRAAEDFKQGKYGSSMAGLMDFIYPPGFKRGLVKFLIRLIGKMMIGTVAYPNDFLVEVQADREMNFKDRLAEIQARTLILSGESDIAYSVDDVRKTAEGIPDAELILYKGYGHNLAMSNWKRIQNEILKFLKA